MRRLLLGAGVLVLVAAAALWITASSLSGNGGAVALEGGWARVQAIALDLAAAGPAEPTGGAGLAPSTSAEQVEAVAGPPQARTTPPMPPALAAWLASRPRTNTTTPPPPPPPPVCDASQEAPVLPKGRRPRVGASIAVHPPKFYAAAMFLREYLYCPAAVEALAVFFVFSSDADAALFKETLACLQPHLRAPRWVSVVAPPPERGWGANQQMIAAYKKWHGVAHMMDAAADIEYGLMVDSELLLYHRHGKPKGIARTDLWEAACGPGGHWSKLLDRIRGKDASKLIPAARVSNSLKVYPFAKGNVTGRKYDHGIIHRNADFAFGRGWRRRKGAGYAEVKRQLDKVLFSWWTDLPWMSISVAKRMLVALSGDPEAEPPVAPLGSWRNATRRIRFSRFEHMSYQQWSVVHEGFRFRDVTDLTGEAAWGSYMEDPQPVARLGELEPLWISAKVLERTNKGVLAELQQAAPPLLVFHADQGPDKGGLRKQTRERWGRALMSIAARQNRTDVTASFLGVQWR